MHSGDQIFSQGKAEHHELLPPISSTERFALLRNTHNWESPNERDDMPKGCNSSTLQTALSSGDPKKVYKLQKAQLSKSFPFFLFPTAEKV